MSHLDTYQLPDSLRPIVDAELQPGERVAWLDQPIPSRVARSAWPIVLFGIPWTAFAVFWVAMASMGAIGAANGPGLFMFFPLFGVPFVLIGLVMLSSPFWLRRMAKRTVYVLTDRRAILFEAGWRGAVTVRSFEPDRLRDLRRKQYPDGSGDLVFRIDLQADTNRGSQSKDVGFLAIRDVKQVEQRVRALAGTADSDISADDA